jgi:hypothetical protein
MGVLVTALTNLAAVNVSGVTSYALGETPDALSRAQLPALVILPELGGESPGLEPSLFSAGDGRLTIRITHMLLLAPVAGGVGQRGMLPDLTTLIDTYAAAMAADPTLGGALPVALSWRYIQADRPAEQPERFDLAGAAVFLASAAWLPSAQQEGPGRKSSRRPASVWWALSRLGSATSSRAGRLTDVAYAA